MLVKPVEGALPSVGDIGGLSDAVRLARVAHKNRFFAQAFNGIVELLCLGLRASDVGIAVNEHGGSHNIAHMGNRASG